MRRGNPLAGEALRGIVTPGPSHLTGLAYLAVQAVVLFLWWPKGDLYKALAAAEAPDPLLAVIITLGATLSYYSLRAGAEEILLPGQHPLGEWVLGSTLGLGRILRGYLAGHLLQCLHAMVLASPLLAAALTVGGGTGHVLGWSLLTVLAQATCYRLAGALVYFTVGDRASLASFSVRALLPFGYAVTAVVLPVASHPLVSFRLFDDSPMPGTFAAVPDPLTFALLYAALSVVLLVCLHRLLSRHRRGAVTDG